MPVAKITGQGLWAIAFSVVLLWSCLFGERLMLRHADAERVRVMQDIRQLQRRRAFPVTAPLPTRPRRSLVTVG
jgi:hypothetical protein